MSFCANCGAGLKPGTPRCVKCGSMIAEPPTPQVPPPTGSPIQNIFPNAEELIQPSDPPKSATTAMILSCFFCGLGQLYLGQTVKGISLFVITIVVGAGTAGIGAFACGVFAMVDAYKIGTKLASGQAVKQWEFM